MVSVAPECAQVNLHWGKWFKFIIVFSHRRASQRSHYSFDPGGSAEWVTTFSTVNMLTYLEAGEEGIEVTDTRATLWWVSHWTRLLASDWHNERLKLTATECYVTLSDKTRDLVARRGRQCTIITNNTMFHLYILVVNRKRSHRPNVS